ncbi:MAG: DUF4446 family protein [Firmicutes bacterium]|nr:DUF4446 family protein [Bacillota bacterium]
MEQLVTEYLPLIFVALVVLMVISLVIFFRAYLKFAKLNSHLEEMLGADGHDLTSLVNKYLETVSEFKEKAADLDTRLTNLENWKAHALQKVALKRYNAFDGVGGDQSFSLALLKGNGEGVILSGLYGRDETRVYAKPVKDGTSEYPLSDEEVETLKAASKMDD